MTKEELISAVKNSDVEKCQELKSVLKKEKDYLMKELLSDTIEECSTEYLLSHLNEFKLLYVGDIPLFVRIEKAN